MEDRTLLQSLKDWLDEKLGTGPKEVVKSTDEIQEQKIAIEVIYEPDVKDSHNCWMSKETLEKACEDFNKNLEEGNVSANLYHLENTDKFEIVKTWIHKGFDCVVSGSGEPVKEGTWIAELQYKDDNLWQAKKEGIIKGVSIFGYGYTNEETGEITELSFNEEDNATSAT